jgi:hypothetical protein
MNNDYQKLIETIEDIKFPTDFQSFRGGGLIVTSNPNRTGYEGDLILCTKFASPLSWLIYQLKAIYQNSISYSNDFEFYHLIGNLIQKHLNEDDPIHEIMLNIVYEFKAMYENKEKE